LRVGAPPAANLTEHVNIGEKVHLDATLALALASFATSAGNVEGKTSRLVTALTRLRQHGIEIANCREHAGIGCRVRARGAADGRLVDANNFVDVLRAHNRLM